MQRGETGVRGARYLGGCAVKLPCHVGRLVKKPERVRGGEHDAECSSPPLSRPGNREPPTIEVVY